MLFCFFMFVNMQEEKRCVQILPLTKVYYTQYKITLSGNRHVIWNWCFLTGVCASLKTEHCKAGSPLEKFMKEHCSKTCEFCCDDTSNFQGIRKSIWNDLCMYIVHLFWQMYVPIWKLYTHVQLEHHMKNLWRITARRHAKSVVSKKCEKRPPLMWHLWHQNFQTFLIISF